MLPYGRKKPLPFPCFEAVAALRFSPVYQTRERQEFKEEGKPQVVLPFCPCRGARHVPAVRRRRIPPLRCSEKLPARKGRTRLRQFAYPAQPVLKKAAAR